MFDNSGKKIKIWAAIIFLIGVFVFIILAFSTFSETEHIYRDSEKTPLIIQGMIYLFGGPVASYVLSLVMYGFGELVDHFCGTNNASSNSNDRIEKLDELRNQDLISEEEYNKAIADIQKADDSND